MNITQLKQGSLNGLRRQTNECIDNAYRKGYEDGKKEPREVTNVEDTIDYKLAYQAGVEAGKKQAIEEIPELANKENEIYNDGYNKALDDVNHAIEVLKDMTVAECEEWFGGCIGIDDVVCTITIQDIIGRTKAYEENKKAKEEIIRVGDEVETECGNKVIVSYLSYIDGREWLDVLFKDGSIGKRPVESLRKTGRHFDEVETLLNKLGGDEK